MKTRVIFETERLGTTISRQTSKLESASVKSCTWLSVIHSRERLQERTGDALASGDDEGRGKLRKCSGNSKHVMIRTCPNGATRLVEDQAPD